LSRRDVIMKNLLSITIGNLIRWWCRIL